MAEAKGKVVPLRSMKVCRGSGGISPFIHYFGTE
jgi:hypothetical protein